MDTFHINVSTLLTLYKLRQRIDHRSKTDFDSWKHEVGHLCSLFMIYLARAKIQADGLEEIRYLYEPSKAMGVSYGRL